MQDNLFGYEIQEIDCGMDVVGTEHFVVGADTPFVGAIIAGAIGGVVGAVVGKVIEQV